MRDALESYKIDIDEKLKIFSDPKFVFHSDDHIYEYDGRKFESVTTFIKNFKIPFDREYWSKKKAIERGVDPSVILEEWNQKSSKSLVLGREVHKYIEDFWMGQNPEMPQDETIKERVEKFLDFYEKKLKYFLPLKSELKIFSKKWRISGTIDQPFLFWDDTRKKPLLILGDWKTNKEFKHDDHPKGKYKKLLRPFADLYENQHNEYSIQISLYRLILEEEAGIETADGFLCHIGPDEPAKLYRTKDLRERLKIYLGENRVDKDIFLFD